MNKLLDEFDNIFNIVNSMNLMRRATPAKKIENYGLKDVIHRPHNLYTLRDENNNIIGHRLEVVTTPFKKDDVKIELLNDVLTIICGTENYHDQDQEYMIYRGISSQSFTFSLCLYDKIDQTKITAKNEDGILRVELPLKEESKETNQPTQIHIQ